MISWNRVAIGLGSNLGDRVQTLLQAIERLQEDVLQASKVSSLYESPPWGPVTDQPPFLNAVIVGDSEWKAPAILSYLKTLERNLGRTPGPQFGPRILDLDLIAMGELNWKGEGIEVPHPRLAERDFVLLPLKEVWPDWVHPKLGKDVPTLFRELLKTQPSHARVFAPPPPSTKNP